MESRSGGPSSRPVKTWDRGMDAHMRRCRAKRSSAERAEAAASKSSGASGAAGEGVVALVGVGRQSGVGEGKVAVSGPGSVKCDQFERALQDWAVWVAKGIENAVDAGDEGSGRTVGDGVEVEDGGAFVNDEGSAEQAGVIGFGARGESGNPVAARWRKGKKGLNRWRCWVVRQSDLVMEDGEDSMGGVGGYDGLGE